MAKTHTFDGITYYPTKQVPETVCEICHRKLVPNRTVFRIGNKRSETYVCDKCIREMHIKKQRYLQENIIDFPHDSILYIGKLGAHQCKVPQEQYEAQLTTFYLNRLSITLQVSCCPCCKNYILNSATYQKHGHMFKDYKLISLKNGKEIVLLTASENKSPFPPKKEVQVAPAHLQQSAFRPYQGGRFSGK